MRIDSDFAGRYKTVLSYTGHILVICGAVMLLPLISLIAYAEETRLALGFLIPAGILCIAGYFIRRLFLPREAPALSIQDGGVIVLLSWLWVMIVSAVPFMVILDLRFTHAFFESVSGWTTTGLSVIDVETAPRTILLWRSIMQLAGGAGIAIIFVTLTGGPIGPGVTAAEGRNDQLVPHVRRSSRLVLYIYLSLAAFGTIALRIAGMSWFDAVNHSFPAISTGGFSTRIESIGYWNSPSIEEVIVLLMIVGSMNFQLVYLVFRGRLGAVMRNGEMKIFLIALIVAIPLVFWFITPALYTGTIKQARVAIFETVSALTTTGFSTTTYKGWSSLGVFVLIQLMIIGGGTGSTAGGIKQYRVYILLHAVWWEMKRMALPRRAIFDTSASHGVGRIPVTDRDVVQLASFAVAYLVLLAVGTLVLVAYGFGIQEALFEFASALGTVGLSVGVTSSQTPTPVLWTEIGGMILGRLEIFIVFAALAKILIDARRPFKSFRKS